jgi:hypothetical protein
VVRESQLRNREVLRPGYQPGCYQLAVDLWLLVHSLEVRPSWLLLSSLTVKPLIHKVPLLSFASRYSPAPAIVRPWERKRSMLLWIVWRGDRDLGAIVKRREISI